MERHFCGSKQTTTISTFLVCLLAASMHAVERRTVSRGVRRGSSLHGPTLTSKWLPQRNRPQHKLSSFFHDRLRSFHCFAHSDEDKGDAEKSDFPGPEREVHQTARHSEWFRLGLARVSRARLRRCSSRVQLLNLPSLASQPLRRDTKKSSDENRKSNNRSRSIDSRYENITRSKPIDRSKRA